MLKLLYKKVKKLEINFNNKYINYKLKYNISLFLIGWALDYYLSSRIYLYLKEKTI